MESVPGWRAIDLARHYGSKNASITRTRFALLVSPPRKRFFLFFSLLFPWKRNRWSRIKRHLSLSLTGEENWGQSGPSRKGRERHLRNDKSRLAYANWVQRSWVLYSFTKREYIILSLNTRPERLEFIVERIFSRATNQVKRIIRFRRNETSPQICDANVIVECFTREKHWNSMTKLLFKLCFKASFEFHGILCEIDLFFLSFLTELYKIFYQTRLPLKKKRGGKELKSKNQRAERRPRESERKSKMLKSSDLINHLRNEVNSPNPLPDIIGSLPSKMHLPAAVWWDFILSRILSPVSPNRGRPLISLARG